MPLTCREHSLMKPGSDTILTSTSLRGAAPSGLTISIRLMNPAPFCCIAKFTTGEYSIFAVMFI